MLFQTCFGLTTLDRDADLLSAMLNSWAALAKLRPNVLQILIPALRGWTPAALENLMPSHIKSVEKALRILLVHINRCARHSPSLGSTLTLPSSNCIPSNSPYSAQINEALTIQGQRMDEAAREEKRRKAALIDSRKRSASIPAEQPTDPKRPKLEADTSNLVSTLAGFDFTSLPASLITDLIIANLEAFTEPALDAVVQQFRQKRGLGKPIAPSAPSVVAPVASSSTLPPTIPTGPRKLVAQHVVERSPTPPSRSTPPPVKVEEPVDPLQMDIDQDELEFEPETLNAQVRSLTIVVYEFQLILLLPAPGR